MMERYQIPKLSRKFRSKPKFTAADYMNSFHQGRMWMPSRAIIVFSNRIFGALYSSIPLKEYEFPYGGTFMEGINVDLDLMVIRSYAGGPLLATIVEEIGALGVRDFLIVGTAGAINTRVNIGDFVLCSRAIRDEGTSYHYAKPSFFAFPDKTLNKSIEQVFIEQNKKLIRGGTWTTDAPYRETSLEVNAFAKMGILTVDMEASALFTVCRKLGFRGSALFMVSDLLYEEQWSGFQLDSEKLNEFAETAQHIAQSRWDFRGI
jgi:uridine phosphorylase